MQFTLTSYMCIITFFIYTSLYTIITVQGLFLLSLPIIIIFTVLYMIPCYIAVILLIWSIHNQNKQT